MWVDVQQALGGLITIHMMQALLLLVPTGRKASEYRMKYIVLVCGVLYCVLLLCVHGA